MESEGRKNNMISKIFNVQKPYVLIPLITLISLILMIAGLIFFNYSTISEVYWYIFPVIIGFIFTFAIYYNTGERQVLTYAGTILLFYSFLIFIGTMPGFYMAKLLPQSINSFEQTLLSVREGQNTILGMASVIFLNNIRIDVISFIPLIGPFVLSMSMVDTASLLWGLSFTEMYGGYHLWFLGPVSVVLAPDTFTELSSYIIAMIGGLYLFKAANAIPQMRNRYIIKSMEYLAGSIIMLYGSAVLESFLIIRYGL
ncbi:MAG: stage II sporulation protein M [Conexivisphaerales archaeon]